MVASTIDTVYLDLFGGFHHRVYCSRFEGSASFTAIRIQGLMGRRDRKIGSTGSISPNTVKKLIGKIEIVSTQVRKSSP